MNINFTVKKVFVLLMLLICFLELFSEPIQMNLMDSYIEIGLNSNLALKQQEFSLEKSLQVLKEARGMFLPSVSIEARYSKAGGGRVIEMPIGDLVNPIHLTLNQLLITHGYTPSYPGNIANEQIPFLRETDQETKLRLIQPLFQPAIYYNFKIKKALSEIEQAKLQVFKRQLVEDIKKAYYSYLKTLKLKELYISTKKLLEENLRISMSLFENDKVTEEVVFRSKAELSKLEQQLAETEKNIQLSSSYFNFLLNRSLESEIEVITETKMPEFRDYNIEKLISQALEYRCEFDQLQKAIEITQHAARLHGSGILPTVSAVIDYGFQGESYSFTGKDDYWMGSLVLSWNLFKGGQDIAKKKQAQFEKKQLQYQYLELENQIKLQVKEAFLDLIVAKKSIASYKDTLKSQEEAFYIVSKKYSQGMVPQIEYIKAQNDYFSAGITYVIALYDYYIKEAQLERISANYTLN